MTPPNQQMIVRRCMTCGHLLNIQVSKSGQHTRAIRRYLKKYWDCAICANDYSYRETFSFADLVDFPLDHYSQDYACGLFCRMNHQAHIFVGNTYYHTEIIKQYLDDFVQELIDEFVHTGVHEFLHYAFEWIEYLHEPEFIEEDIIANIMVHWEIPTYWNRQDVVSFATIWHELRNY